MTTRFEPPLLIDRPASLIAVAVKAYFLPTVSPVTVQVGVVERQTTAPLATTS